MWVCNLRRALRTWSLRLLEPSSVAVSSSVMAGLSVGATVLSGVVSGVVGSLVVPSVLVAVQRKIAVMFEGEHN